MSIGLGMPAPPAPTLAPRRKTRQLMVRDVGVGSDYPISVQSMCTTKTHDVNSTLQQIAELTAAGCDIVRVACPRQEDADALPAIAKKSNIPVIADVLGNEWAPSDHDRYRCFFPEHDMLALKPMTTRTPG